MSELLGERRMPLPPDMVTGSSADFSECGTYRYVLRRNVDCVGDADACPVCWIMLNPSTADVTCNDPTVARCQAFTRRWGFNAYRVVNLFALRATSPKHLKTHPDPFGPHNDAVILRETRDAIERGGIVVCAWGTHGALFARAEAVVRVLEGVPLYALTLTKHGQPRHPLYLPGELEPVRWYP